MINLGSFVQLIAIWALPVLFAVTLHEVAHGWVACWFGDKTALLLGRLSFNPMRHIDAFGTIIVPLISLAIGGVLFGWAKPVPVNSRNLRHGDLAIILVALAGPLSNLLMALLWAALGRLVGAQLVSELSSMGGVFFMARAGVLINTSLFVLNMLPIPPLDGSSILVCMLPKSWGHSFRAIQPFGTWILLALLCTGLLAWIMTPMVVFLSQYISRTVGVDFGF